MCVSVCVCIMCERGVIVCKHLVAQLERFLFLPALSHTIMLYVFLKFRIGSGRLSTHMLTRMLSLVVLSTLSLSTCYTGSSAFFLY